MHIDHVAVAVRDITTSLPWYRDQLGLAVVGDELLSQMNVRLAYLGGDFSMVQLVQPVGPGPIADFLAELGEGLHHICLAVDDIPATLRGLPGQAQITITMGGRGRRACFLAGPPNGLRIELTEREPFNADAQGNATGESSS